LHRHNFRIGVRFDSSIDLNTGGANALNGMDAQSFRESITAAIRYWEPRRLIYNIVLAAIVLTCFVINYPHSKSTISVNLALLLFLLAVLANVAYCAAYPVDVFISASSYREQWFKYRWVIFLVGVLFAATITRFFALGMFQPGS
jgi:hypothetical protein